MRRVAVTGMGIVSSIGNNCEQVLNALKHGRSGIVFQPEYAERGFRSQVEGSITLEPKECIDRRLLRFMGDSAAYNYIALQEAIAHAGLTDAEIRSDRTGLVMGSGGASCWNIVEAADIARANGVRKVGPYRVTRTIGTSTPIGDRRELEAIAQVFGDDIPPFSSTKSLTGHALGAAGVHEVIYSLLMMQHGFIAASSHIEHVDDAANGMPLVRARRDIRVQRILSNSFGFGGANACLVLQRI